MNKIAMMNPGLLATQITADQRAKTKSALRTRREVIALLSEEYADGTKMVEFMSVPNKTYKKHSKVTKLLIGLAREIEIGVLLRKKEITQEQARVMVNCLRVLACNPQYAKFSFELHHTAEFQHALALLGALKLLCALPLTKLSQMMRMDLISAVADINIRLYSMHVDERLD